MDKIGILFNNCYGGFSFSDAFVVELGERIGEAIGHSYKHYRYRDHPEAVKLFLEKGTVWSSGSYSKLHIEYIPLIMKNYYDVSEYDGMESVGFDINSAIVDKLDEYLKDPTPKKLEWLKDQVKTIRETSTQSSS
jgi:hypothetical protein